MPTFNDYKSIAVDVQKALPGTLGQIYWRLRDHGTGSQHDRTILNLMIGRALADIAEVKGYRAGHEIWGLKS